jgi:hypothetical protein
MNEWPAEYLNKRQKETDMQMARRYLWYGKFAFPKINTKKTRLTYTDKWDVYIPTNRRREFDRVQLQTFHCIFLLSLDKP